MDDQRLKTLVENEKEWIIGIRRKLHRIPEAGFKEFKTQRVITDALDEIGIPYTTERTWIVGIIEGKHPGRTVAIRADIDALPIVEPLDCEFRSQHEGMMHACGHDAHTAMALGAAKVLNGLKDQIHGNVKFFFQPAEETDGGAEPMIRSGVMENPHVDRVYGLHVMPHLPVGKIETRSGTLNASTDTVMITIRGQSGHGAYPDLGTDAIVCAAQVVTALQTIVARNVSPLQSAVLTIGKIQGGTAQNIICDEVHMQGTLRTANAELRAMMKKRIEDIVQSVSVAMGCSAEVVVEDGYAALVNHPEEAARIKRIAARLLGAENVVDKPAPSMGGEDFSFFCDCTAGAFFHIGCVDPSWMPAPPLHSKGFKIDEECLAIGTLMHVALALDDME